MENNHTQTPEVPSWLMITVFLVFVLVLFVLGDALTGTLGTILIGAVFANYYTEHSSGGH
ncbi:MAG: hypothetical protein U0Y10_13995 [Spirosomataceae bacterium]